MAAQEDCCQICTEVIVVYGLSDCCEHYFCYACLFKWCSMIPKGMTVPAPNKRCPICKRIIQKILNTKTRFTHNIIEKNKKLAKVSPLDRDEQFKKLVMLNYNGEYAEALLEFTSDMLTNLQARGIDIDIAVLAAVDELRFLREEIMNNITIETPDDVQTEPTDSDNESNSSANNEDCYGRLVRLIDSILAWLGINN